MSERSDQRRRQTIEEIVSVSLAVMTETGAAGLSLGEVAKRMGIRTPSLYGYFGSKAALCDELFSRGWTQLADVMAPHYRRASELTTPGEVHVEITSSMRAFIGWAIEHRAAAELMFWRPIHGWEPSPASYAAAAGLMDDLTGCIASMQSRGFLAVEASVEEMVDVITVLSTGVISQQLANEPGIAPKDARYLARLDALVDMFLLQFATPRKARR